MGPLGPLWGLLLELFGHLFRALLQKLDGALHVALVAHGPRRNLGADRVATIRALLRAYVRR